MINLDSDLLKIGNRNFRNRLIIGTGKFSANHLIPAVIEASGAEMVTVALRRMDFQADEENILNFVPKNVVLIPNTSGARNAEEAVRIARLARELGCGDFVKIEVIHEMKYLIPDNEETVKATEVLAKEGFVVLPYVQPDPIIARKLEDVGASAVMPLGSPIGSGRGLRAKDFIEMVLENTNLPVVVDAGIGKPSHAAEAMEIGADAVLINTAIATADDPVSVGKAFALAVEAGRMAFLSGIMDERKIASASSPLTGFLREY